MLGNGSAGLSAYVIPLRLQAARTYAAALHAVSINTRSLGQIVFKPAIGWVVGLVRTCSKKKRCMDNVQSVIVICTGTMPHIPG